MPVTNYYTINGEVIGESTGSETTTYVRDALGSVTATVDSQGKVQNTYRYKPYGGLLSKTGGAPNPRFMWNGATGSRTTGQTHAEQYNRARHYSSSQASWTTKDPLWPEEGAYNYAGVNPTTLVDPEGTLPRSSGDCAHCHGSNYNLGVKLNHSISRLCSGIKSPVTRNCVLKCAKYAGRCIDLSCLDSWCASNSVINCDFTYNCGGKPTRIICPSGCCNAGKSVELSSACAVTNCQTKQITFCCAGTDPVFSTLCGGKKGLPPGEGLNCNSGPPVIFHELVHACACKGWGCNPDTDEHGQWQNNAFGWCVSNCLGIK